MFDLEYFFKYYKMIARKYEELLRRLSPVIIKSIEKTESISPSERQQSPCQYVHISLAVAFKMQPTTVRRIVREVCVALWEALSKEYLPHPKSKCEWIITSF